MSYPAMSPHKVDLLVTAQTDKSGSHDHQGGYLFLALVKGFAAFYEDVI